MKENSPLQSICILRLSAIGDACQVVALVQLIQRHFPNTKITWVIGKMEANLLAGLPNVEFIIFDKSQGLKAYFDLYRQLRKRRFDVLLHMQVALRASIASLLIRAKKKIGFDKARARDLQWFFTHKKIHARTKEHVTESFLGFSEALGISDKTLVWDVPIAIEEQQWVKAKISTNKPLLVINAGASVPEKNWQRPSYAKVAEYAIDKYGFQVVLTGGSSEIERSLAEDIIKHCRHPLINLTAKTSLKQLLALLKEADILLAPDTGPAHMATMVDTPVLGLYACTNSRRTGPYKSLDFVVDYYQAALQHFFSKTIDQVRWGKYVYHPDAMKLIPVSEVLSKFDEMVKNYSHKG